MAPNRWLHLRHHDGFDEQRFEAFKAYCRIWRAYVEATLAEWKHTLGGNYPAPAYEFFEPEISADRKTVTLPVGGEQTLGSRSKFENIGAHLLWENFPFEFQLGLEEGLTERDASETNWRKPLKPLNKVMREHDES